LSFASSSRSPVIVSQGSRIPSVTVVTRMHAQLSVLVELHSQAWLQFQCESRCGDSRYLEAHRSENMDCYIAGCAGLRRSLRRTRVQRQENSRPMLFLRSLVPDGCHTTLSLGVRDSAFLTSNVQLPCIDSSNSFRTAPEVPAGGISNPRYGPLAPLLAYISPGPKVGCGGAGW